MPSGTRPAKGETQWCLQLGALSRAYGGEMVKLTVRILTLLTVLALGRIVVGEFFQSNEPRAVLVVLMPGGNCAIDASAPENARGN